MSLLLALLLSLGAATQPQQQHPGPGGTQELNEEVYLSPVQAILLAAEAEGRPVEGAFQMVVRGIGRKDGNIYLNSETDYRDQRSLTISIAPSAQAGLRARLGGEPDSVLLNRRIRVNGHVRRMRINFTTGGLPTGKYYFQTHVYVDRPEQIRVEPFGATPPIQEPWGEP